MLKRLKFVYPAQLLVVKILKSGPLITFVQKIFSDGRISES